MDELKCSIIFDLLITSHEFKLEELVKHLQTYLVTNNAPWLRTNFTHVYQTCFQLQNFETIQKFCTDIIVKHPSLIFESENFLFLPEDALISIIRLDDLQLEEDKIFDYVIEWGRAKNPALSVDFNEWTSENFLTLKTTLTHCLPHIRYFHIPREKVLSKLCPYQQLFEPKLWSDIITKLSDPNEPISTTMLSPRKIVKSQTLPTRESSIILSYKQLLEISSWIDKKEATPYTENNPYEFQLIFRGSRDGFEVKKIYEICDEVPKTVIVLKVEGTDEVIGGYNPFKIRNNVNGEWFYNQDTFVFSLKAPNSILSRVNDFAYALYYDSSLSLLQFGNALNLCGNLKTERKSSCGSYCFYYYRKPIRSNRNRFSVEELEIFKVSPR